MKRNIIVGLVAILIPFLTILAVEYFVPIPKKQHKIETTKSQIDTSNAIKLIFVDSVDGRPVYNVLLPDGKAMDYMYPEEIANSLNVGKWSYNEDLKVQ